MTHQTNQNAGLQWVLIGLCGTHRLVGVISLQRCNDVAQYSVISPKKEPRALERNYSNAFYRFIIKANARNKLGTLLALTMQTLFAGV